MVESNEINHTLKWVTSMRWDFDLFQWQVIKFGGLVVVALIVFIHIVRLVREAIAEIRKPLDQNAKSRSLDSAE
jgi:hypothetical protein